MDQQQHSHKRHLHDHGHDPARSPQSKEPPMKKQKMPLCKRTLDLHHIGSKSTDLESMLNEQRDAIEENDNEEPYDALLLQQNFLQDAHLNSVLDAEKNPHWSSLFRRLNTLVISTNAIQVFPRGIELLAGSLRTLNLANNRITELPESISLLHNLVTLDLRNNCIEVVEGAVFNGLTRLKWISLSNNQITNINELPVLPALAFLGLFGNKLSNQEQIITIFRNRVASLRTLTISGNEQLYPAPEYPGQASEFKKAVVHALPDLQWLDSHFITAKERQSLVRDDDDDDDDRK